MPEEHYFIQQQTLCTYKSEHPSKEASLLEALRIIGSIYVNDETNDPETLGLVGAIYKRLYLSNDDIETLRMAMAAYGRGFMLTKDYYTGENFATCLDLLSKKSSDQEEVSYCSFLSKQTRKDIISTLSTIFLTDDSTQDRKWMFATMANCYFHLDDSSKGNEFEKKFLAHCLEDWERNTYFSNKPTHV
jgi:hypothetical protein